LERFLYHRCYDQPEMVGANSELVLLPEKEFPLPKWDVPYFEIKKFWQLYWGCESVIINNINMFSFSDAAFSLIAVGILWGATNPFIKKGSAGVENVKAPNSSLQLLYEVQYLVCRWQVVI